MNDEFLLRFRRTPRAEFADALYDRISSQPQPRSGIPMLNRLTFRNVGAMFALMLFVAACVYAVVDRGWRKVGDIWVQVERTHKVELFSPPETSVLPAAQPECLTLDEARKIVRFEMHVPTWAPEGFVFDDRICSVDQLSDFVGLSWKGVDEQSSIFIMLQNLRWFDMASQQYRIGQAAIWGPVAPGSYDEVQIHGQPAVLVRGDWDYVKKDFGQSDHVQVIDSEWDSKIALQLHWVDGEVMYHLYTRPDVSPEDLIRMAESAR